MELSQRLKGYIDKVEATVGRPILIRVVPPSRFARGIRAQFFEHDECILVEVSHQLTGDQFEWSVAHEVTHGLLRYGEKYCSLEPARKLSQVEAHSLSTLLTMLEDPVVNRIMEEQGFCSHGFNYLSIVRNETRWIRKGEDPYRSFASELLRHRYMVFRFVLAWAYLEYFELDARARRTLHNFLKAFESECSKQYDMAIRTQQVLHENNIFTPLGFEAALRGCLSLWGLGDLVNVVA